MATSVSCFTQVLLKKKSYKKKSKARENNKEIKILNPQRTKLKHSQFEQFTHSIRIIRKENMYVNPTHFILSL